MVLDELLRLRDDGTTTTVDDTEAGTTTALSRVATTGQSVIDLKKTPTVKGLACVLVHGTGTLTTTGDTFVVTIEASDEADFATAADIDTICTFPALVETGTTKAIAANMMVRRIHTKKRYVRSVLTASAALATGISDLHIFLADMIEEDE